ncbi:hypothetical protein ACFYVR_24785 [Rhodococcus sp. NPDC003318]
MNTNVAQLLAVLGVGIGGAAMLQATSRRDRDGHRSFRVVAQLLRWQG